MKYISKMYIKINKYYNNNNNLQRFTQLFKYRY